ncbi:TPA: AAA family ATPase, partial [Vibrio parahaemolyticus]
MLLGVFLRNFKIYNGWHYIPLSNSEHFSALVGENGVGKSSVLEALDVFFNKPYSVWNYNHSISKSGFDRPPTICPVFLLKKDKINKNRNIYKQIDAISNISWQIEVEDFTNEIHRKLIEKFCNHLMSIKRDNPNVESDYFLLPCGFEKKSDNETINSIGLLSNHEYYNDELVNDHNIVLDKFVSDVYEYFSESYEYIYIPSEIDYETYTKIEGKAIQSLMGTTVDSIIKEFIDDNIIKKINSGLDNFLKNVEDKLEKYEYKKPAKRQTLFNLSHLTSKIIETYFDSKVLNLKKGASSTPIYHFSSGEKRRAIIDLAQAFILNSDRDLTRKNLILAMDEPEVSLHTSACYQQFKKLELISHHGYQTLISTHWYGFLTAVSR